MKYNFNNLKMKYNFNNLKIIKMSLFYNLPKELQGFIYEFDSTYKDIYNKVIFQINMEKIVIVGEEESEEFEMSLLTDMESYEDSDDGETIDMLNNRNVRNFSVSMRPLYIGTDTDEFNILLCVDNCCSVCWEDYQPDYTFIRVITCCKSITYSDIIYALDKVTTERQCNHRFLEIIESNGLNNFYEFFWGS